MNCNEISWLAGLLDAEGCFSITKHSNGTRKLYISISMTHLETMQKVSKLLDTPIEYRKPTGQAKSNSYHCKITGAKKVLYWSNLLKNYLFTKQEQCILLNEMATITIKHVNNSGYFYTKEEKLILNNHKIKILELNKKSTEKSSDQLLPHKLSSAWIAGVLDGDGSICICRWKRSRSKTHYYKPVVKIGMNDKPTIDCLSNWFDTKTKINNKKTKKKATNYSTRLLTQKILEHMPSISQHLITKNELGKLIIEFAELKRKSIGLAKAPHAKRLTEIRKRIYEINHSNEV